MQINSTSASAYPSAYDRPVPNRKLADDASDGQQYAVTPVAAEAQPSASKLFMYGALGLQRPEVESSKPADGYDLGRWLAAGVEVGMIISVLV